MNNIENITFGIELETIVPTTARIAIGHYHNGFNATSAVINGEVKTFPSFQGATWKTERDGSIITERGYQACEFVSPILKGEAGIRHLIEFVEFLRSTGAKVNASTGMHIHVGVNSVSDGAELTDYIERLTRLVGFNTKALYAQTGTPARENGRWCAKLGPQTKASIRRMKRVKNVGETVSGNRYQILNLTNLTRTGTVEFRCFAGTLNTSKIIAHLASVLLLCIISKTAKTPAGWENKTLTGTKAVTNLLKVRPVTKILGSPAIGDHWRKACGKALQMAAKYDAIQAGIDLAILTAKA